MKKVVLRALNIEEKEFPVVMVLSIQAICLGIFYGSYDIGAHTLFLKNFESSSIPVAYIWSGLVGIVLTTVYTSLLSKLKFSILSQSNFAMLALLTISLRIGLEFTESKNLIFAIFIFMTPTNTLGTVCFWGMLGRIFTIRQGKRLFGFIGAFVLLGIVLSSYATSIIPLLFGVKLVTKNFLILGVLGVGSAFFLQNYITRKYNINSSVRKSVRQKAQKLTPWNLMRNSYIRSMTIFTIFSVVIFYFVQFLFLAVTRDRFPIEKDLASFLGVYTGTLMIFSLSIRAFFYNRLIKSFGIRICLLILPVLLLILISAGVLSGIVWGFAGFTIFFIIIALSRLFAKSLRDSVEAPAFKLLFQSLDLDIRYQTQSIIEGTVNLLAAVFAGILLFFLKSLPFMEMLHFSILLLMLSVLWLRHTMNLSAEYHKSLLDTLSKSQEDETESSESNDDTLLFKESANSIIYHIELCEYVAPIQFENILISSLSTEQSGVKEFCLRRISQIGSYNALDEVKKIIDQNISGSTVKEATRVYDRIQKMYGKSFNFDRISKFIRSVIPEQRELASRIISTVKNEEFYPMLTILLRDEDLNVRLSAIISASKIKRKELTPFLIDNLYIENLRFAATHALIQMGESALENLELTFYKQNESVDVLIAIIEICSEIKSERVNRFLITKINHQNRHVAKSAVYALIKLGFKADESLYFQVKQAIELDIKILTWNLAAINMLSTDEEKFLLIEAIESEQKVNIDLLFKLLSLLYDTSSIDIVRKNIESGTSEGIGFALELLDIFLAEDMKPLIYKFFDEDSDSDKIKHYQNFFPLYFKDSLDVCLSIINRDINLIQNWTKACAIFLLKLDEPNDSVVAHLYNSDIFLRESAAWILYKMDSLKYRSYLKNLKREMRKDLENRLVLAESDKQNLLFEKAAFILKLDLFSNISNDLVVDVALKMEEVVYHEGNEIINKSNRNSSDFFIIIQGSAFLKIDQIPVKEYLAGSFLGEMCFCYTDSENSSIFAREKMKLYKIKRNEIIKILHYSKHFENSLKTLHYTRIQELEILENITE